MKPLIVDEGAGLMDYLARVQKDWKRTTLKQYLKFGRIEVNGRVVTRHDHALKAGDRITYLASTANDTPVPVLPFPIIYQDDSIIVVDKPAGLLTIATDKEKERTAYFMLTNYVRALDEEKRIFIVHRLDRETSGLLVFAKTETAKRQLQDHWDEVEKIYLAVVEGVPEEAKGTIRSHLHEDRSMKVYSGRETADSKLAVTEYEVIKSSPLYSLLEINLRTGRKNQIRVHCGDIGHPVVGDKKYGSKVDPARRLCLHASQLSLVHPETKQRLEFRSKLPKLISNLMKPDQTAGS